MRSNLLFVGSSSLTVELLNGHPFYSPESYDVFLNNKKVKPACQRNVFSVYGLSSDTHYDIRIVFADQTLELTAHTKPETALLKVKAHGAIGDGVSDDTDAIQKVIDQAPDGARIVFEKGTYVVTSLSLRSHRTLELSLGATLLGSPFRDHFPVNERFGMTSKGKIVPLGTWEGEEATCYASIIQGFDVQDVAIVGEGVLDGNGEKAGWWIEPKKFKTAWRPHNIFLNHCEDIVIQGIQIQNSPSWTIHPFFSRHIHLLDLNVLADKYSPNTDGCDPQSCFDVRIIGTRFSVGDDCIAIKSGKWAMAQKYHTPSNHITIRNCLMNDGHGAVVLGSEMGAGIKNLHVSYCLFENTDRGVRVKTRRGRGRLAVVDGVKFHHIRMNNVLTPLVINMFYNCDPFDGKTEYVWSKKVLPIDERTPYLGRFEFRDMECLNATACGGFFYGLPEQPIGSIKLKNIHIAFKPDSEAKKPAMMSYLTPMKQKGLLIKNVDQVVLKNVTIENYLGPLITQAHVGKITGRLTKEKL